MCTLILGRDVLAPRSVLVAANRDEDPARASDPPGVLRERPRLIGGRDRRAGGTWLAIRDARAMVAILNRPDPAKGTASGRRSRGALTLEVAAVDEDFPSRFAPPAGGLSIEPLRDVSGPGLPLAALCRAVAALGEAFYAPFTLVFASPEASWLIAPGPDGIPHPRAVGPGWHVLTHADLDDPGEPRTAWLMGELRDFRPDSVARAEERLGDLLRSHGDRAASIPPVCLHEGPMVTVSASMVWLRDGGARYRHVEGRPCERPFEDLSARLAGLAEAHGG